MAATKPAYNKYASVAILGLRPSLCVCVSRACVAIPGMLDVPPLQELVCSFFPLLLLPGRNVYVCQAYSALNMSHSA